MFINVGLYITDSSDSDFNRSISYGSGPDDECSSLREALQKARIYCDEMMWKEGEYYIWICEDISP